MSEQPEPYELGTSEDWAENILACDHHADALRIVRDLRSERDATLTAEIATLTQRVAELEGDLAAMTQMHKDVCAEAVELSARIDDEIEIRGDIDLTEQCCESCPYTPQLVGAVLRAHRSCSSMAEAVEAVMKSYVAKPVWSGNSGAILQSAFLYGATISADIESAIDALPQGDRLDPVKIARQCCPFGSEETC